MEELLNGFLEEFLPILVQSLAISSIGYAFVLLFGRMLDIAHTDKVKNAIAGAVILIASAYYLTLVSPLDVTPQVLAWEILLRFSFAIIIYVILFFRFVPRMDNLLDKRLAPDEEK